MKQYDRKNWDTYLGTYPGNGVLYASLLLTRRSLVEGLQASTRMIEKKWKDAEVDITMRGVDVEVLMASYVKDNTS